MNDVNATLTRADVGACWTSLARNPLELEPWLALEACYRAAGLPWHVQYVRGQAQRLGASSSADALPVAVNPAWQAVADGGEYLGLPRGTFAQPLARQCEALVAAASGDWLSWLYLARLCEMAGLAERAEHARVRAQKLEPIPGESAHWIGLWRLNSGDAPGAVTAWAPLVSLQKPRFGTLMWLGEALHRLGRIPQAEAAFTRASMSDSPDFLLVLARRVFANNYWAEAIQLLQKACSLRPQSLDLLLELAQLQAQSYCLQDAQATLAKALVMKPDHHAAQLIQCSVDSSSGRAQQALDRLLALHRLKADPNSRMVSTIAMTSLYCDAMSAQAVATLHRDLCEPLNAAARGSGAPPSFALRMNRKVLRLGFVTGDLHRQHPVRILGLPLIQGLDAGRFQKFVYYTGEYADHYTGVARESVQGWLECRKLSDLQLRQRILDDQIDVLIDLAGHTSGHRLGVFAMRAAPIQMTFMGYPHSTGLEAMGWIIGDGVVSPMEHQPLYSERIAQLPHCVFCYAPDEHFEVPAPRSGPPVFGSFNNLAKLSPSTIELWARLLREIPQARLLLKAPSLRNASVAAELMGRFESLGVERSRLECRGPSELGQMMQEYGDIDFALDPVPYNGGMTSMQALWMGVPVLTLEGANFVSRMGSSILRALGKPEWVAGSPDQYLKGARALVDGLEHHRHRRGALREQFMHSPLGDMSAYVRSFEDLLEQIGESPRAAPGDGSAAAAASNRFH